MAIYCVKCEGENDNDAAFCKTCGGPLSALAALAQDTSPSRPIAYATPPRQRPPRVQTVQQTSKTWKGMQLVGALLVLVGVCGAVVIQSLSPNSTLAIGASSPIPVASIPAVGAIVAVSGVCVYGFGRVMAWWHHG